MYVVQINYKIYEWLQFDVIVIYQKNKFFLDLSCVSDDLIRCGISQ